jgi:hypothetical protein
LTPPSVRPTFVHTKVGSRALLPALHDFRYGGPYAD